VKTYTEGQILHHAANSQTRQGIIALAVATSEKFLDAPLWIDLHGAQVGEAINQPRLLAKLLSERIAEVVRRIGGDDQDGLADLGELDGERTRRGRLANTSLAADEDPAECLLVDDGLEAGLHNVVRVNEGGVGHGGVRGGAERLEEG